MGFFKSDPIAVEFQGHQLTCVICSYHSFWKRDTQLNTIAQASSASIRPMQPGSATFVRGVVTSIGFFH